MQVPYCQYDVAPYLALPTAVPLVGAPSTHELCLLAVAALTLGHLALADLQGSLRLHPRAPRLPTSRQHGLIYNQRAVSCVLVLLGLFKVVLKENITFVRLITNI